jgi:hypothetical protein
MDIDPNHDWEREHVTSRIVIKGRSRMCSRHHRILEDLSSEDQDGEVQVWSRERFDMVNMPMEEGECESEVEQEGGDLFASSPRNENTARRVKPFSLPAVAVQTTSVVARTGTTGRSCVA